MVGGAEGTSERVGSSVGNGVGYIEGAADGSGVMVGAGDAGVGNTVGADVPVDTWI